MQDSPTPTASDQAVPDPTGPDRTEPAQVWDAAGYARHAHFVADLAGPVLELLAPQPGEHVLDLGCGDGRLSATLVAAGCRVTGVDAASAMIVAARARGLDPQAAEFRQGDGTALSFAASFDAVFSNAALHWMGAPDAVIAGVHRALKPRGRFVGEMGGHGNVAAIIVALLAALARRGIDGVPRIPWYFPTAEAYGAKLAAAGFVVDSIALIARPTPLPTDMEGWLATFAQPFFAGLDAAEQAALRRDAIALLRPCLCDTDGRWTADYVRLRFAARRSD